MSRREMHPADIARALKAAAQAHVKVAIEISVDGVLRIIPQDKARDKGAPIEPSRAGLSGLNGRIL